MGASDTARQPLVVFACTAGMPYAGVVHVSCIEVPCLGRGACWLVALGSARGSRLRESRQSIQHQHRSRCQAQALAH